MHQERTPGREDHFDFHMEQQGEEQGTWPAPLTSLEQLLEEQQQRQRSYDHDLADVNQGDGDQNDITLLGSTRKAFTSAITSLPDYSDELTETLDEECPLDDSGIIDYFDGNSPNSKEVAALREKLESLQKENEQLKCKLNAYQCEGEFHIFHWFL